MGWGVLAMEIQNHIETVSLERNTASLINLVYITTNKQVLFSDSPFTYIHFLQRIEKDEEKI